MASFISMYLDLLLCLDFTGTTVFHLILKHTYKSSTIISPNLVDEICNFPCYVTSLWSCYVVKLEFNLG